MEHKRQLDSVETRERARMEAPEVSWALRDVLRAGADVDAALADRLDLSPNESAAMNHLMTAIAPMGPVELGARLGISSGSATGLVDRLEKHGHVERHPHPDDRRRLIVTPTDTSIARILRELRPLFSDIDRLVEDFTPAELDAIERYLRTCATRLRKYASGK